MSYEYEPIKDLEKEIEYVRWNHENITHAHQKAVVGTQLKKLEARLHKFKQAAKADEYEAKAKAWEQLVDTACWHLERIDPEGDNVLQLESFYKDIRDEPEKYERADSND